MATDLAKQLVADRRWGALPCTQSVDWILRLSSPSVAESRPRAVGAYRATSVCVGDCERSPCARRSTGLFDPRAPAFGGQQFDSDSPPERLDDRVSEQSPTEHIDGFRSPMSGTRTSFPCSTPTMRACSRDDDLLTSRGPTRVRRFIQNAEGCQVREAKAKAASAPGCSRSIRRLGSRPAMRQRWMTWGRIGQASRPEGASGQARACHTTSHPARAAGRHCPDCRALVVGAWGCGAFENDPALIARLFREELTDQVAGAIERVVLAVTNCSPERRFVGPFECAFAPPASVES